MFSIVIKSPILGVGTEMNPFIPKYGRDVGIVGFRVRGQTDTHFLVEFFSDNISQLEIICMEEDIEVFEKKY